MQNIFIDDERDPRDVTWVAYPNFIKDWIILRNYNEVITWIKSHGLPDFISFDNDLGEEKEGFHIAKYIVEYCLDNNKPFPHCAIHSKNPIAADRIESLIQSFNNMRGTTKGPE